MTDAGALDRAFAARADGVPAPAGGLVGVFGSGVPLPLVEAAGARCVDIKAPPLDDAATGPTVPAVAALVEDFMDPFAARFLHRFAAGAFDRFALLIFARDDVAALSAYQYAREMRRLGHVSSRGPALHLWNLTHGLSAAIARFNRSELARLTDRLQAVLGARPDPERLAGTLAAERRRAAALAALPPGGVAGFTARNAGRWMTADAHCAALSHLPPEAPDDGPRIALVGTACDTPVLHDLCAGAGRIVVDCQEYGRDPGTGWTPDETTPEALIDALAADPLALRATPPHRFTDALRAAIAGADLVISSVSPTDDAFGWEVPLLRRAVEGRGGRFLDLGFRPFRPDAAWCAEARQRITEALA